jgi:transcriptional regulator GlxA family with amidase domain
MKHIGALVFPKFELLDLCGPLQMFGVLKEDFSISFVAADKGPMPSNQHVEVIAKDSFIDHKPYDIFLSRAASEHVIRFLTQS